MTEKMHTTPNGEPMVVALAEESLGALAIEPTWFGVLDDETFDVEGNSVAANLVMFGEDGEIAKKVRVRLSIESVEDADSPR